ncbi:MAG: AGE family epimerase/isomerase [Planctomycetes bacterium]|nr:AGE family epimerase/isomerase [Planctomycetota bacterium]
MRHAVDREDGGFTVSLDRDGRVVDTDKAVWQQARFTWLLGEVYNEPLFAGAAERDEWLELALHGADFLEKHCVDPSDGRMWYLLTKEGRPLRKRRYAFTESFAAIAFGELFRATGVARYRDLAQRAFDSFVAHECEPKWTGERPMRSLSIPMITIGTAQELRESIGLERVDERIDAAITVIRDLHVREDMQCVLESVGMDGGFVDTFDGRLLNPGHAIEAAWFVLREARHRDDGELCDLGCKILDWSWARGRDAEHGGLLYFIDARGLPVSEYWHDMKFWWPHNEAIIATLMAFAMTGERRYAEWHAEIHGWAHEKFRDREFGEWFGYLHRTGTISSTLKGNHWKGPFHMPRMQIQCARLAHSMSSPVE